MPKNFNPELLGDEFSPLLSGMIPKLLVGAEYHKYHGASSSTNQPLLSLKSHKWKHISLINSSIYVLELLKITLGLLQAVGEFSCISQRLRGTLCSDYDNEATTFSFLLHKNHYIVAQEFAGVPTNTRIKVN